tara:strand:- start:313 stop:657 length:345 start_codon:yes stop_codon:yes gene_type:complete
LPLLETIEIIGEREESVKGDGKGNYKENDNDFNFTDEAVVVENNEKNTFRFEVECQPKETSSDHLGNSSGIILGAFSVDKIDEYKDLPVDKINVVVFPAGPTKVLRVIDKRIEV